MKLGKFSVRLHNCGCFKLDGGSMFGAIPKPIWNRLIPGDERNRIRLAANSLIIEFDDRKVLVDVGMGTKWSDKLKDIYAVEENNPVPDAEKITDVILTHMHFDHCGGISYYENDKLQLTYPDATIHIQKENYELAKNPNIREQASYLAENVDILSSAKLNLIEGEHELFPDLSLHQIDGHTKGQQWIKIQSEEKVIAYPSDLMPTSHHINLPYHMGYDMCTRTLMNEKGDFVEQAVKNNWIVVFQHDPELLAGTLAEERPGRYSIRENFSNQFT